MDYAKVIESTRDTLEKKKARVAELVEKKRIAKKEDKDCPKWVVDEINQLGEEITKLEEEIEKLIERQIKANQFASYMEYERESEKAREEFEATAKYTYVAGGEERKTNNPALAARYDAQHRFFGMSKTKQAMAKMTGKWKKFNKLWNKSTDDLSLEEQEEIAKELNSMFRK